MKTIISIFISAYQPSMASVECRNPSSVSGAASFTPLGRQTTELHHTGEQYYATREIDHDELCWAISRARKHHLIGYYITYLRYVRYQAHYAQAVNKALIELRLQFEQLLPGDQKQNPQHQNQLHQNQSHQNQQQQRHQRKQRHQQQLAQSAQSATNHLGSEAKWLAALPLWLQQHEEAFCQAFTQQLIELNSCD